MFARIEKDGQVKGDFDNGDVKEIVDYETIEGRYSPSLCWVQVSEEHLNGLDENWHKKIDKLKLVDGEIKLDNG